MRAGREAKSKKNSNDQSGTDLQQNIAKFKSPDSTVSSKKKKKSRLNNIFDQPSQAHSILTQTSESPSKAEKEAKLPKVVSYESGGTDLQQNITQLKPPDPNDSSRKKKNTVLKKVINN